MSRLLAESELVSAISKLYAILPKRLVDSLLEKLKGKKLTQDQLANLIKLVISEYYKAVVDPCEAIGIVTAQSIGEPSTQMVLRSFHFAGIREFSMALGLPRMIEIVDARRKPLRPTMTIYLKGEYARDANKALEVAKKIQLVTIENVARSVNVDYITGTITIEIDMQQLEYRGLSLSDVKKALSKIKGKGAEIRVENNNVIVKLETLDPLKLRRVKDKILQTRISGIKNIRKAIVRREGDEWVIVTEGTNLEAVLLLDDVDHRRTISNDIHEVARVLGIEAARTVIIRELKKVLDEQGLEVDIRHIMLTADAMTWTGRVKQVGRHGVVGEKESPLAKAAFEVTIKNLVEASLRGDVDSFRGVVESIIAGKHVPIGTGYVEIMMEFE